MLSRRVNNSVGICWYMIVVKVSIPRASPNDGLSIIGTNLVIECVSNGLILQCTYIYAGCSLCRTTEHVECDSLQL